MPLFRFDNDPFAVSYFGAIAESFRERAMRSFEAARQEMQQALRDRVRRNSEWASYADQIELRYTKDGVEVYLPPEVADDIIASEFGVPGEQPLAPVLRPALSSSRHKAERAAELAMVTFNA